MTERYEQLADAFEAVARVDHYMVGIVEKVTREELDAARDLLITRQNALAVTGESLRFDRLESALDLIDDYLKRALAA